MTRVIKVGGRAQSDPRLAATMARAAEASSGDLCIVHGGGDELSALQRRLGIEPRFRGGRRVTTREDVELARMALSGSANKRLVAALRSAGVRAAGISGEDGVLLMARQLDAVTLGAVGQPSRVDTALVRALLGAGFVPVISPLASDAESGIPLNVNGDDAATAIAVALGASELLLVVDVPGVLENGDLVADLDAEVASDLVARGSITGGMAAKLEAARAALAGGVPLVRVAGVEAITDSRRGTTITLSPTTV